jgi:hypothetical protein
MIPWLAGDNPAIRAGCCQLCLAAPRFGMERHSMSTPTPAGATPDRLFYTLAQFHAAGGPGKTKAYALEAEGKLQLVRTPHGTVGVTPEEARRFIAASVPIRGAKLNRSRATEASLAARRARKRRR